MSLITQGKTNIKYLLIVVILVIIATGGILIYSRALIECNSPADCEGKPGIRIACIGEWECVSNKCVWNCKGEGKPELEEIKDETADLKTYRNEECGFSFEYPLSWLDARTNILSTRISIIIEDGQESDSIPSRFEVSRGFYYNQDLQRKMTLGELIDAEQSFPVKTFGPETFTSEKFILGEWEGIRRTYHVYGIGYFTTNILLAKPSDPTDIISFSYRHDGSVEYKPEMPQTLDQILSTFRFIETTEEFCGWSTQGVCASDADCIIGGCSSQVCQSKSEEPIITTCEFKECYVAKNYGFECKCVDSKCQWSK